MLIHVSNINDRYLSCFEHPLALCLSILGKDYRLFFVTSWNFSNRFLIDFTNTKSNMEMQMKIDAIQSYLGIKFKYNQNQSMMLDQIKKELDNQKTVIIHMNSVYCSWLTSYQTDIPTHHYILIIGYTDNSFLCLDMNSTSPEVLSYDDLMDGCIEYMFYSENEYTPKTLSAKDILDTLNRFSSNEYQMCNNIKQFSYYIGAEFDIQKEIKGYEPFKYAPFFTWIKGICASRMNYKRFLEWMIQACILRGEYIAVLEGLNNIYKRWYHIIMCLIRCVYYQDAKNKFAAISRDIAEVAELENEVLCQLKCCLTKE